MLLNKNKIKVNVKKQKNGPDRNRIRCLSQLEL